ncbi:hypothetical protein GCM10022220_70900 [Actinocatenispora rupis]|uniref:Uncharacterized protein n=1 Tax=Actinocatenispora rupis TaxID=519421 RepID=A0A8J3JDA2_9ACTN|nr:hypothetical protein Aru02nite_71200 [Actinocatenispora rupis]
MSSQGAIAAADGVGSSSVNDNRVTVGMRTGDTPAAERRAFARRSVERAGVHALSGKAEVRVRARSCRQPGEVNGLGAAGQQAVQPRPGPRVRGAMRDVARRSATLA